MSVTLAVDTVINRALQSLRPPPRLNLSQWADEKFYLSAESAAEAGPWKTLSYQREIMDAITDPAVERVSVMKSARVGFTKILNAAIGYYMEQDPCPIMLVQPTIEDAQGYSKEEIAPMLRDCPALTGLVSEQKTRDSDNTILHKSFRGGSLSIVGATSGRGFRRVSRRVVAFDEVDGYPSSAGGEGDPIRLGIKRSDYYWNRKLIAGSTPLLAGSSRIEALFAAGDQRRYFVPCTQCGHMDTLVFRREATESGEPTGHFMHWPKDSPQLAHFVCRICGGIIEHKDKRAMVDAGQWRACASFTGHASFHIWAAYSFSPNATWGQLAQEFVSANSAGPDMLKTFVNTVLGQTWFEKGEAPEWERLYQRRERYPIGSCPPGVLFLTAGVDVQKTRFVYEVVGWGRGKRSWSVDAGVIEGDTADVSTAGPWGDLDALLERTYDAATGVPLPILRLAIDSGFNTQTVYNWARQKPLTKVVAVKGVDGAQSNAMVGAPSPVDIFADGRRRRRAYRVWAVAGSIAKTELYGWLGLPLVTDAARSAGSVEAPGYCHFPEYGEDYFKQLTGEHMVAKRIHGGRIIYTWEPIPGRENHQLDCRVYARAAAAIVGLDRFQETDWQTLERRIGHTESSSTATVAVALLKALTPTAPPVVSAQPAQPPKRKQWIQPRSDWLKGRR